MRSLCQKHTKEKGLRDIMITKEEFVAIIDEVEQVHKYSDSLNHFFHQNNVQGYLFQPNCTETALRLLHLMFKQADTDEWISYFCYELNFGRKWKEGTVKDRDGADIKLQTPEDLYDFLRSNM